MHEDRPLYDPNNPVETPSSVTGTTDQDPTQPVPSTHHRPATANAISSTPALRLPQRRASLSEKRHSELFGNGQPLQPEILRVSQCEDSNQEPPSPPVIVDHQKPVSTLRKYYTELDASVQQITESPTKLRRSSYTLPAGTRLKAESVPNVDSLVPDLTVNTDDKMPVDQYDERIQRHATSVEELRQIFERGETEEPDRERRPSMRRQGSFHRYSAQPIHSNMSKSVEFFSRPPKYRTPSPRPTNLPTPPPLPLPPSSPETLVRTDAPYRHNQFRSRNYVTRFSQCAQPIVSMHMPFRSRSLALDRTGWSSEMLQARPRTGSITQRSVSPLPLHTNARGRSRRKHVTRSSRPIQKRDAITSTEPHFIQMCSSNSQGRENPRRVINKGTQSQTQAIVPYGVEDTNKLPDGDVIRLSPADTDGVYVRSAVVYERVADRTDVNGQRHFVTTYVISQGPSPSRSTVQATNLWVAEQALLSAGGTGDDKQTTLPPYRTQTLPRPEQDSLAKPVEQQATKRGQPGYSSCRVPGHPRKVLPRPRSLSTIRRRPVGKSNMEFSPEPPPLPTPPPADMHRYMLRCSSQDASLDRLDQKAFQSSTEKAVQWERPRHSRLRKRSASPARSWSVRSLSPPPFRTPWLSSMGSVRSKRSTSKSPYPHDAKQSESRYNDTENLLVYDGETGMTQNRNMSTHTHPCYCGPCSRSHIEAYELERARQREARARQEWVHRAETVSRERQAYHHMRGSWSPPALRSPARNTPNNLEEQTEREIRYRVRQHKPLSPVPVVPIPIYPNTEPEEPQEPIAVDEAVQCDEPELIRSVREHLNVDTDLGGGIDTTPITENFDGKRAYFEELIRTNKLMARCSFCSDCFHCPHGQIPRFSCCSSWDSELHQACSPVYTKGTTAIVRTDQTRPGRSSKHSREYTDYPTRKGIPSSRVFHSGLYDSHERPDSGEPPGQGPSTAATTRRVYKVESIREPAQFGPQQYASSLCLTTHPAASTNHPSGMYRTEKSCLPVQEGHSIQHDYYARPQMAMPKVAPNPPTRETAYPSQYHKWTTALGPDSAIQPSRAELIHSPTITTNYAPHHSTYPSRDFPLLRDEDHSPGCRFYDGSRGAMHKDDSWDSLNAVGNDTEPAYRGRVRQIVCELNERATQDTQVIDETYPAYSTPDLRRSVRYN
ncbi:unnamed protein product [Echinostoma caproni]|uniref:DUF4537 domain-containing protein n=1 Tax=Echinostoma caproni TaxID=27848 RepID=A0A183AD41_9TREM|nr:unnamed protein product [Echinostoma caproni]